MCECVGGMCVWGCEGEQRPHPMFPLRTDDVTASRHQLKNRSDACDGRHTVNTVQYIWYSRYSTVSTVL